MSELVSVLIIVITFYALLPMLGGFNVRRKWRFFRSQVVEASLSSEVSYSIPDRKESGAAGSFSFTGGLQAIQDDSTLWLNNDKTTVRAELEGVKLYLLPASQSIENGGRVEDNKELLPKDMPKRLSWERVYSLVQGTGILLSGQVFIENGTPVFRNTEQNPLLVIIYDGSKDSILKRSIWSGRQLNEYWNSITPFSLMAGSFLLFVLAIVKIRQPDAGTTALFYVLMSLLPLVPFLPPGLFLYFIFRRFWKTGRYLRGERDLLRLPLRFADYKNYEECSLALDKYPKAGLRSCGVINDKDLMSLACRVYSSEMNELKGIPEHFFENLIIPGDPEVLAEKCKSRARIMEILAAASVGAGFIINIIVIYLAALWLL